MENERINLEEYAEAEKRKLIEFKTREVIKHLIKESNSNPNLKELTRFIFVDDLCHMGAIIIKLGDVISVFTLNSILEEIGKCVTIQYSELCIKDGQIQIIIELIGW